jgi:hypothetical protein
MTTLYVTERGSIGLTGEPPQSPPGDDNNSASATTI